MELETPGTDDGGDLGAGDKLEKLEKLLECPVCLKMMRPPVKIWMCSSSHLVCDLCKNSLEDNVCPTCRIAGVNMRAFTSENMAGALFTK